MTDDRIADVLVIGGGASALAFSVMLGKGRRILLECAPRAGKKLLATGNGRCNLTGMSISPEGYSRPDLVRRFLNDFPPSAAVEFFRSIGLETRVVAGRVYPYSECASSVLSVLLAAAQRSGAEIRTGRAVTGVKAARDGFEVTADILDERGEKMGSETYSARFVVLATGSPATSGRDSLSLFAPLGHAARPFRPSLVPLKTDRESVKGLNGVRVKCAAELAGVRTEGEILFRDYGLSGIAAMDLSALYARGAAKEGDVVTLDLAPEFSEEELAERFAEPPGAEMRLHGMFHSRVAERIAARAGDLSPRAIASAVKRYELTLLGVGDASSAQVMSGGLDVSQFDSDLCSRLCDGAYAMGETLDVDGICGGFNLHWAWMSAHAVARGISRRIR